MDSLDLETSLLYAECKAPASLYPQHSKTERCEKDLSWIFQYSEKSIVFNYTIFEGIYSCSIVFNEMGKTLEKENLILIVDDVRFINEIRYTFDFITAHPVFQNCASKSKKCTLYYGSPKGGNKAFKIPRQNFFFSITRQKRVEYCANKYLFENSELYSVEQTSKDTTDFISNKEFAFDLIETIFFHISRYEENYAPEQYSEQGWLDESNHFLVYNKLEKTPVVDHLVYAICQVLFGAIHPIPTSFSLTHDIDRPYRFKPTSKIIRIILAAIIRQRGIHYLRHTLGKFFAFQMGKMSDPFDTYDFLFSETGVFKNRIVYILNGGNTTYDFVYPKGDRSLIEIIEKAESYGYDVGLHPSYKTARDSEIFRMEKSNLEKIRDSDIDLTRQHYLRWFWNTTPHQIELLDFKMDSSLGYRNHIGFRCGTGYPYYLFNFETRLPFTFLELPLIFMDSALVKEKGSASLSGLEVTKAFLDDNKFNTHVTINFHNSNFDDSIQEHCDLTEIYLFLLENINHFTDA